MNDNFNSLSAARLKSERLKLNKKQAEAADLCGVSREMWGKYERGLATPGGEVLFSFAAAGADMHYILTGETKQQQLLKLIKESAEIISNLNLEDEGMAADLLSVLFYVAQGDGKKVAESMRDYAGSNLTIAEKDLLAAYRKAADVDKAFMERLAALATQTDQKN
jgi:transcriptional regulator with XRE-family HTH domain